ncbi:MAG: DUF115 domain-containing protein [Negativicutes bacterium]|nr:DUF115 domain-containing protein [Negativicutes bacterium]
MVQKAEAKLERGNWAAWKDRYGNDKQNVTGDLSHIEILASRTGLPTVRVTADNGRAVFLHSSVDPVKEAQRIASGLSVEPGAVIVVNGFGLGYLVEAILTTVDEKIPLFVLEPDSDLFCTAMKTRDLRHVISSERVYILKSDAVDTVKAKFARFFNADRYNKIEIAGLPGNQTVYRDFFRNIDSFIYDVINTKLLNMVTLIKLGGNMLSNGVLNLPNYYTHPGVIDLFDRFANIPTIIVSAGPSLNKNIHLLHEAKGKAVILAVGTAVKALQKQGIEPDFIISVDPHPLNYEHFRAINTEKACLIADINSNYMIQANYKGPMFVAGWLPVMHGLGDVIETKGILESGGSVANSAFALAYKIGADPIILVGQDLAYSRDGHSHAAGTNYESNVITEAEQETMAYLKVKANDGGQVITGRNFYQFLCFFESWIRQKPDRNYINATEGGALIEGTKILTLREVLDQYCLEPIDVQKIIHDIQSAFETPDPKPLVEALKQQVTKVDTIIAEAKTATKRLNQLETACENRHSKKMQQHVNAIRKIYKKFSNDVFLTYFTESLAQREIHQVIYRTYQAEFAEQDDFHAAIADYHIYYEKVREGAEQVKGLFEECIKEVEERIEDGCQSLRKL